MAGTLETVGRSDVRTVAAVLSRAFRDDPVMAYLLPRERDRRRIPALFAATSRWYYMHHEATEIVWDGGEVRGAAVWAPPGQWSPSLGRQLLALPSVSNALRSRTGAASALYAASAKVHPLAPHWYLAAIGVDPVAQGNGYGGALLRSRLTRCDEVGAPAYLEASKHANIAYYERFGFEVHEKITVQDGPTTWGMWREPGAG
ncbi:MAG TPA: GNAT family N-acetyltransferase [Pseudonocardiaceae bacterium]|nr:GNAT family N-acetyltransferase [Pseudonocardiaceae bacterium]